MDRSHLVHGRYAGLPDRRVPGPHLGSQLPRFEASARNIAEAVLLVILLGACSFLVFQTTYPLAYAPILFVIWASMRFRLHGATLGTAIVTGMAVVLTSVAVGPFIVRAAGEIVINDSLLLLQLYIGLISISSLMFAAAVVEVKEVRADRALIEGELNAARQIQMSMIPLTFPAFPDRDELSVRAILEPAKQVGGDFYDFFFVDDDTLCFCIADVSGKGVPAALFMAVTRTQIETSALTGESTSKVLTRVNNEISRNNDSSMFVTVFLGVLNVKTGKLVYTNAGHNPPYLTRIMQEP